MAKAWIGLGSNLNNPQAQVKKALIELDQLPDSCCIQASSLWLSKPLGPQDQPDFINAAALLETSLSPLALLDHLQHLEQLHQRVRLQVWGPRTLDLDLLLYDQIEFQHPRLQIPHSQIHLRPFVLEPLLELEPGLEIPGRGSAAQLAQALRGSQPQNQVLPLEARAAPSFDI